MRAAIDSVQDCGVLFFVLRDILLKFYSNYKKTMVFFEKSSIMK